MKPAITAPIGRARFKNLRCFLNERGQSMAALFSFFVLTFAWSWPLSIVALSFKISAPIVSSVLSIISGFGPSLAALVTVYFFSGGASFRAWLKNALNWRIGWRWYAMAFFGPPVVMTIGLALHLALGGTIPPSSVTEHIPLAIANFGLVFLIGGPLGEELGWRSYALPALGSKIGWRAASLLIGMIWGLWHLPLFFMAGTAQFQMSITVFMLNILAGSVVFSWLFIRTAGSVLPALMLHTSLNSWAGILSIVPTVETSRPYALVTGLIVILALWLLLRPQASAGDRF